MIVQAGARREQFEICPQRLIGNAVDLEVNFFPWAHFELVGLARYQSLGPSTADEASASLLMLQLHYYL